MPILSDPRHERFAQLVSEKRMSNAAAYRQAVGKPEMGARAAASTADKWLNRADILSRIAELKARTEARCSMTREEFVESLIEMYRGAPGEATLDNKMCDSLISRGVRHAVFPMKTAIAAQLAKVLGYDAPTKIELEAGENLETFLGRLFVAGKTLSGNGTGNGERASIPAGRHETLCAGELGQAETPPGL
jgi:hypothetical protein